jgi:hypothetical protein
MDTKYRRLISIGIGIHLALVALAMVSNLSPSQLQTNLLSLFVPYLKTLNLELGLVPVELTHNFAELEGPFQFQVQFQGDSEDRWKDLARIFTAPSDSMRLHRLGREIAALQIEERDNEVAEIFSQLVRGIRSRDPEKEIIRIRLRRELMFSRSDFNSPEYKTLKEEDTRVKLFQAKVITVDGETSLIQELEDRRASKSVLPKENDTGEK